jgi:hypothetical protein
MKNIFILLLVTGFYLSSSAQNIGSKVSFVAVDGKTYTGVIQDIQGNQYKIKYDGFDYNAWLSANQFTVVNSYIAPQNQTNLIGTKVSFLGTDGKMYTAVITDKQGNNYKIKYDGYNFTTWVTKEQVTVVSTATTYTQPQQQTTTQTTQWNTNTTASTQDINSIFNFGKRQGWASVVQENKLNEYLGKFSQQDKNKLVQFINQAKTNSAKFFVLKSWLAGDSYDLLQKFINQVNQYPENYQQEKCLMYSRKSIIQQWQQTCSVTTVQTFLGDLCPRYAWEVKQISNYDAVAIDPNHPIAQQQKMLLEKYGGVVSARGSSYGKEIGINQPLNEWVGRILGVQFYAQQVNEPLPVIFGKIRAMLDKGISEPLLIGFDGGQKHFILILKYRNTASDYEYLIYDPWEGLSDYVSQANLEAGSMAPLNNSWRITIDYYYPVYE